MFLEWTAVSLVFLKYMWAALDWMWGWRKGQGDQTLFFERCIYLKVRERDLPPTGPLPRCPQQPSFDYRWTARAEPNLNQEAGSSSRSSRWWQEPRLSGQTLLPSQAHYQGQKQSSWVSNQSSHIRYWCPKEWLNMLYHDASHRSPKLTEYSSNTGNYVFSFYTFKDLIDVSILSQIF